MGKAHADRSARNPGPAIFNRAPYPSTATSHSRAIPTSIYFIRSAASFNFPHHTACAITAANHPAANACGTAASSSICHLSAAACSQCHTHPAHATCKEIIIFFIVRQKAASAINCSSHAACACSSTTACTGSATTARANSTTACSAANQTACFPR